MLMLCTFYFKRLKPFQAPFSTTASHFPLKRMIHSVKPSLNQEISTAISRYFFFNKPCNPLGKYIAIDLVGKERMVLLLLCFN